MSVITYQGSEVILDADTSVLEGLESAGFIIPSSCRAGICQSCIMQTKDNIPVDAQQGLSVSQIAQGYFLSCSCYPQEDMSVSLKGKEDLNQGKVLSKVMLNHSVLCLLVQVDFRWFPGQYLTLWRDSSLGRPYSIASRCNQDKIIELHVKRHQFGKVSSWLHNDVVEDDLLNLSSPVGDCFYSDDHHNKPLLLVGTGTGLAPLYGILLEAIEQKHTASIYLYVGGGEPNDLYYQETLKRLSEKHSNIHYTPVVKRYAKEGMLEGDIVDVVQAQQAKLNGWKVFLCGTPSMVSTLQRSCFFSGASIRDILTDAFDVGNGS